MGKLVIKRVRPTLKGYELYKNGRQSSRKMVVPSSITENISTPRVEEPGFKVAAVEPTKKSKEKEVVTEVPKDQVNKGNTEKKEVDTVMMDTKEKVELASAILTNESSVKAKRIRKDKGLIERKESTIILTEDNRELLKG